MKQIRCHDCGGHGLVCDYGITGEDFYGAKECDTCDGSGFLYVTKSGRLVLHLGGPFRGSLTKDEMAASA